MVNWDCFIMALMCTWSQVWPHFENEFLTEFYCYDQIHMLDTRPTVFIRVYVDTDTLTKQYSVRSSALCLWMAWHLMGPLHQQALWRSYSFVWNSNYSVYQSTCGYRSLDRTIFNFGDQYFVVGLAPTGPRHPRAQCWPNLYAWNGNHSQRSA